MASQGTLTDADFAPSKALTDADFAPQQQAQPKPIGEQPVSVGGLARTMGNQAIEGAKGIAKTVGRDAYGLVTSPAAGPLGMAAGYLGKKFGIDPRVEAATETNPDSPAQTTGKWLARAGEMMIPGPEAIGMFPNAERAGKILGDVTQQIGHVPVDLTEASQPVMRALQLAKRGHGNPPAVIRDMAERIPQHNPLPMNFAESRDFSSAAGKLSATERQASSDMMQAQVKQLAKALSETNMKAAQDAGLGPQFQKGIDMYRRAMKLGDFKENAGEYAKKIAARVIQGAGLGAGYEAYHGLKGER